MTVAFRIASTRSPRELAVAAAGRIARVEVFDDFASVETIWRRLEQGDAVKTPYQSFDLLACWQRHIGTPTGVTPFVVAGFDAAGEPVCLWPLGRSRMGLLNIVGFLGGKHANFNIALWRRDIVESIGAEDIRLVLDRLGASGRADILALVRQPHAWQGITNPFALLPHQPSPSASLRLTVTARGEEQLKLALGSSMRGRLRSKEKRLQQLPGYRYRRATTADEVERLLAAFFPLKAAHMKAQSLPNTFGEPCHEAFLRDACHLGLADGKPLVEIHAIESDEEQLAIFGAVTDGHRSSGMFNTYTLSDNARQSPGLILLMHVITDAAERDVQSFDLGVGEANYKTFFCKEHEPLFDSFLPLTPVGKLAAVTASAGGHLKRQIKQNSALLRLVSRLRHRLFA